MWYMKSRWQPRLRIEQYLMSRRFPQFRLTRTTLGGLHWRGVLRPAPGYAFLVTIVYPINYPYREPHLRIEAPPLRRGAPHVYSNGSPCIHPGNWDPETGTAASSVALLSSWLVSYVHWVRTGERF